jgi:hypothetical protein
VSTAARPSFTSTIFRPFGARQTYLDLVYSLLGLPLGIFYFTFVVTGLSLGIGLAITWVGIPILALTLAAGRGLAQLERTLAVSLLGAPMPRLGSERESGWSWRRLFSLLRSGSAWRELAYLLLRFPLGVASFSITVSVIAAGIEAIVAPFLIAAHVRHIDIAGWRPHHVGLAFLAVPVGIALLAVTPGVIRLLARLQESLAMSFLGRIPAAEFRRAVARSLARGEADPFSIITDLTLYYGAGPHLTLTRLQATLLAFEELGLVSVSRGEPVSRYSLTTKGYEVLARA